MVDDRIWFGPGEAPSFRGGDSRTYPVLIDGVTIGTVRSRRTESWRQLSSGVRYSMRGKPKHWEAEADGWTPPYNSAWDRQVGYHFTTRAAAAEELLAAFAKALEGSPT